MSLACVGSTGKCSSDTGFAPAHRVCAFPSTLLRLQAALQGASQHYVHFPAQAAQVQFLRYPTKMQARLGLPFVLFPVRAAQATGCLRSTLSSGAAQLLPSPSPPQFPGAPSPVPLCLFWGADLWLQPSRGMKTIQNLRTSLVRNWKPVCSLVGDALSGAEFAPFRLLLAPASPFLQQGMGGSTAGYNSSLVLLSPLFCEGAGSALG